jgi:hypothetical protein
MVSCIPTRLFWNLVLQIIQIVCRDGSNPNFFPNSWNSISFKFGLQRFSQKLKEVAEQLDVRILGSPKKLTPAIRIQYDRSSFCEPSPFLHEKPPVIGGYVRETFVDTGSKA